RAAGADPRVLWRTLGGQTPFLALGNASVPRPPILDGNFQMNETLSSRTTAQRIDVVRYDSTTQVLSIEGRLQGAMGSVPYSLRFSPSALSTGQLHFEAAAEWPSGESDGDIALNRRLFLTYWADEQESFHGFGESFTNFDMSGRRIPILVSEQGVGRGEEPVTSLENAKTEGVGGHWYTTYCPKALYLTSYNRSVLFENSEVMYVDLTRRGAVELELWGTALAGNILYGRSMRALVGEVTAYTGRMMRPPLWSQEGAVIGLEGGTEEVTAIVESLRAYGVPLAGVWLQDWVGLRHDWDGDRLIYNWEVNYDWYPGWQDMVGRWQAAGTRVLTYVNPHFSDPTAYTNQSRHNFYQEGIDNGYFVKRENGSAYNLFSLSIEFCMVDLTNPAAVRWMKDIIRDYSLSEARSSGWMADFGEYLPFDAVLHSGESAASYHNRYPEEWARLTAEVLEEEGLQHEVLFFMRSAWMKSPQYNSIFWEGDQLVSWDEHDGLKSAVLGALSGGLCGHAISHTDIGGYTVLQEPLPRCTFLRTEELFDRWAEFAAFGAGLFRTHVGSSTSSDNFNVYDSPASMVHFAEFASIYAALMPYRSSLIDEAVSDGTPLIRPLAMNYAYDATAWRVEEAYLFGDDFLVAPCMDEGSTSVDVYFPALSGRWVHLWSGRVVDMSASVAGLQVTVPAPVGFPPVFFKADSAWGASLRNFVVEKG
ncbi:unnamed protein product, partial [Ectocarpus fasciculatus]